MAPKFNRGQKSVARRVRNGRVPKRLKPSAKALAVCRTLESTKAILDFLGISYSQAGAEYARLMGGRSAARQSVHRSLSAKHISDDWLQVLGQLLSNRLTRICGETIGIAIVQNSPMHVTAYRYCNDCGRMYAIDLPNATRCKKCRK